MLYADCLCPPCATPLWKILESPLGKHTSMLPHYTRTIGSHTVAYTFHATHSTRDTCQPHSTESFHKSAVQLFVPFFFSSSAHDGDVKEANKQKCQQPGQQQQQQGQTVYHGSGQTATVAQYLHWPCVQCPQQAPQPGLAPNHRPASYLSHSTASLQTPNGNTQAITALQDPKSSITNRAYQVSMHYTCAAPCFDRWWVFQGVVIFLGGEGRRDTRCDLFLLKITEYPEIPCF